jgi:predicted transcriptional regulator
MGPELTAGLSRRERQIMDVLYTLGKATVNEVLERISDPPSYSAVRATMRVLEDKGQVVHLPDGPRDHYRPVLAQDSARSAALRHLVRTFFGGSAEAAAAALLRMNESRQTDADLRRLAAQVESARDEGR